MLVIQGTRQTAGVITITCSATITGWGGKIRPGLDDMATCHQGKKTRKKDIHLDFLLRVERGVLTLPAGSDEEEELVVRLPPPLDGPEPKSDPDTRSDRSSPIP